LGMGITWRTRQNARFLCDHSTSVFHYRRCRKTQQPSDRRYSTKFCFHCSRRRLMLACAADVKKDQRRWNDNDCTRVQHNNSLSFNCSGRCCVPAKHMCGQKSQRHLDQLRTYGRIYREFADKRWIGCAGERCRSLRAKTRFGDSQVRKTRVLRLEAGPLVKSKVKVRQLREIE